jgi:hypothetical protein
VAKDAKPDRYVVDRIGSPDPASSEYYVLDVTNDRHARTVLGLLIRYYRQYGQQIAADEIEHMLAETQAAHAKIIQDRFYARNPNAKKSTSKRRSAR